MLIFMLSGYTYAQERLYGAVYINKTTGITGAAWDWVSEGQAVSEAEGHCLRKNAGKPGACERVVTFYNGCVAIFLSDNGITGWGLDAETRNAKGRGYTACMDKGGINCKEITVVCTTRYY